jgi:hypothetical protein
MWKARSRGTKNVEVEKEETIMECPNCGFHHLAPRERCARCKKPLTPVTGTPNPPKNQKLAEEGPAAEETDAPIMLADAGPDAPAASDSSLVLIPLEAEGPALESAPPPDSASGSYESVGAEDDSAQRLEAFWEETPPAVPVPVADEAAGPAAAPILAAGEESGEIDGRLSREVESLMREVDEALAIEGETSEITEDILAQELTLSPSESAAVDAELEAAFLEADAGLSEQEVIAALEAELDPPPAPATELPVLESLAQGPPAPSLLVPLEPAIPAGPVEEAMEASEVSGASGLLGPMARALLKEEELADAPSESAPPAEADLPPLESAPQPQPAPVAAGEASGSGERRRRIIDGFFGVRIKPARPGPAAAPDEQSLIEIGDLPRRGPAPLAHELPFMDEASASAAPAGIKIKGVRRITGLAGRWREAVGEREMVLRRLAAGAIDLAVWGLLVALLYAGTRLATGLALPAGGLGRTLPPLLLMGAVLALVYDGLFGGTIGQTPGMMLMRIRFERLAGGPPELRGAFVRAGLLVLALVPFGLGLPLIMWRCQPGSWRHDQLAGVLVGPARG